MGLFDRNHYDRDFGAHGGAWGRGREGHEGGLRGAWHRVENGVRDAFDAGGYDRNYTSRGGTWGGNSYGGPAMRGGSFDRDDSFRAGSGGGGYGSYPSYGGGYDTGYRAGGYGYGNQGHGEGVGDRLRHGWNRVKEGARDAFDRDDDRDLTYRGSPNANLSGGLSRENRDEYGYGQGGWGRAGSGYDRDLGERGSWGATGGGMMGRGGYDRDLGGQGHWMDRDSGGRWGTGQGFKSREQTDAGDPFGDRANRTPIRMVRGGFQGGGSGINYDRPYRQGIGDEPYYNARDFDRGEMRGGAAGGYDRGWRNDRNDWF